MDASINVGVSVRICACPEAPSEHASDTAGRWNTETVTVDLEEYSDCMPVC